MNFLKFFDYCERCSIESTWSKNKFLFIFPFSSCAKSTKMIKIAIISLFVFVTVQALSSDNRPTSSTGDLIIHEVGGFQFPLEKTLTKFGSRSITKPSSGDQDQISGFGIHRRRFASVFKMLPNWMKFTKHSPNKLFHSASEKTTLH